MILRVISLILAAALACNIMPVVYSAECATISSEEVVVDMNNEEVIISAGAEPSKLYTQNSIYTAHWYNHPSKKLLTLPCTTYDWSKYGTLYIPVYSVKATGANLRVVVYLDDDTKSYKCSFPIDWEGYKILEVDILDDLMIGYANLDKINKFQLWTGGWGDVPSEESDLYIGTVTASVEPLPEEIVTDEELRQFAEILGSGFAVYNYSGNLYTNGTVSLIDENNYKTVIKTRNNESVCPAGLFETISGATIKTEEKKATITLGKKTITVTADSPEYTAGGKIKTFNAEPFVTEGILYVPLVTCARELGLNATSFDNLTVIANEDVLAKISSNRRLVRIGSEAVTQQAFTDSEINSEDFAEVKKNWRESLVGSEELNNLNDADIKYYVDKVDMAAKTAYGKMNTGKDILVLFGDKFPEVSNDMTKQYEMLLAVALGYGTYGTSMYMDSDVKKNIIFGLDWLYENLYGQDEMKNEGWRNIEAYNWHDWFVGTPQALEKILFIMEPELHQGDIDKYMSFFNWRKTVVYTGSAAKGGDSSEAMTRLYVCTGSAILAEDAEYLFKLYSDFDFALRVNETSMVEKGKKDGVHTDGMWVHHNKHPYQAMYGKEIIYDRAQIVLDVLGGTKLDPTLQNKHNLVEFLFDTFDPVTFHGVFIPGVKGRSPGEDYNDVATLIRAAIELIGDFGPDDDERLKSFVKRHVRFDTENYDEVLAKLPISDITLFKEILSDETIKTYNPPSKMYYSGDVAVQHRSDYSVGLRMSSERIANYESINDANKNGWYTGDGMLCIYPYVENHPYRYTWKYFRDFNPYHVPGTTEDSQERQLLSINADNEYLPKQDFVGGVEVDNEYILAAMDFKAFNNDVPPTGDNSGYGGMQPLHDNDLVAKKSWFMFDNEVLALGSGINSTKNSKVLTTVENKMLDNPDGSDTIIVDGQMMEKDKVFNRTFANPAWVHFENYAGYYFPQDGEVILNKNNNNQTCFAELMIDHGENPDDGSYAYVVLPASTSEETEYYAKHPDVEILSNTDEIHAARDSSTGLTGIVFWQAGSFLDITVSNPCTVMVRDTDDYYELYISDPTLKLQSATLLVHKLLEAETADDSIEITDNGNLLELTVDFSDIPGRTHYAKLKKVKPYLYEDFSEGISGNSKIKIYGETDTSSLREVVPEVSYDQIYSGGEIGAIRQSTQDLTGKNAKVEIATQIQFDSDYLVSDGVLVIEHKVKRDGNAGHEILLQMRGFNVSNEDKTINLPIQFARDDKWNMTLGSKVIDKSEVADKWIHIMHIIEPGSETGTATDKCYLNGKLWDTQTISNFPLKKIRYVRLFDRTWSKNLMSTSYDDVIAYKLKNMYCVDASSAVNQVILDFSGFINENTLDNIVISNNDGVVDNSLYETSIVEADKTRVLIDTSKLTDGEYTINYTAVADENGVAVIGTTEYTKTTSSESYVLSVTPSEDKTSVSIDLNREARLLNKKILVCFYNEGTLIGAAQKDISLCDESVEIAVPDTYESVKVFVWDNISTLNPLCGAFK